MATISIESYKIFNACILYVNKHKKYWQESVNNKEESTLSITEEDKKFAILTLLSMSSYSSNISTKDSININSYEFTLLKEYLK